MVTLSDYQGQHQKIIDAKLEALLSAQKELLPALHEAMHYAVFSGGKRIRPLLVLAAAQAVGGQSREALLPAAAVELFHTYTLIHDDLPAMDNDKLRRGQPTVHIKFGEANAILAGDALQALAFATLATHEKAAVLLGELGKVGIGVVAGQWADMAVLQKEVSIADINFIHEHKTTALIRTAVRLGGIAGHAREKELTALTEYGTALGHLFQLTDDLLDADTEEEKPTAVTVYGREKTVELTEQYLRQAQKSLTNIPAPELLHAIAEFIHKRSA